MDKSIPPGSRFITVHPYGHAHGGHPVLISRDGTVLGGMGGKFNGKHLSELYSDYPKWEDSEGDQIPDNLRHVNPAHNPHLKTTAHFGPEFQTKVEGTPQYQGGTWQAQVRNRHLSRAAAAGRTQTPEGGTIAPHASGAVTYSRSAPNHPGKGGFGSFAHAMGRDLVGHIRNWLGGEHQARMGQTEKGAVDWSAYAKRPPGRVRDRPTEADRAPDKHAPFGYTSAGLRDLGPRFPGDPLTPQAQEQRALLLDPNFPELGNRSGAGPQKPTAQVGTAAPYQQRQPQGWSFGSGNQSAASVPGDASPDDGAGDTETGTAPVSPSQEKPRPRLDALAEGLAHEKPTPGLDAILDKLARDIEAGAHPDPDADHDDAAPGDTPEPEAAPDERLRTLHAAHEQEGQNAARLMSVANRTPLQQQKLVRVQARQRGHAQAIAQLASEQGWNGETVARLRGGHAPAATSGPQTQQQEEMATPQTLPGFDQEAGTAPVDQAGGPGAMTHEQQPGAVLPPEATPPEGQYQAQAPVQGVTPEAAPASPEPPSAQAQGDTSPKTAAHDSQKGTEPQPSVAASPEEETPAPAMPAAKPRSPQQILQEKHERGEATDEDIVHYLTHEHDSRALETPKRMRQRAQDIENDSSTGRNWWATPDHHREAARRLRAMADQQEGTSSSSSASAAAATPSAPSVQEPAAQKEPASPKASADDAQPAATPEAPPPQGKAAAAQQHPRQRIEAATLQSDPRAATAGWKLHLAAPQAHHDIIETHLRAMKQRGQIAHYKREGSGGQEGKDFTVYAGGYNKAEAAATHIQEHLGHHLDEPHGETLGDDTPLSSHVMGRFDVGAVDPRFHQYGRNGLPYLNDDMHTMAMQRVGGGTVDPAFKEQAEERAHNVLSQEYGSFYHGMDDDDDTDADAGAAAAGEPKEPTQKQEASSPSPASRAAPSASSAAPEAAPKADPSPTSSGGDTHDQTADADHDDADFNPAHYASYLDDLTPEQRAAYERDAKDEEATFRGKAGRLPWAKSLLGAVRGLGGLRGSHAGAAEYAELPQTIKDKTSPHTTDTMLRELAESHPEHTYEDANDLHAALMDAGQVHLDNGINVFGKQRVVRSANERRALDARRTQARKDQRAAASEKKTGKTKTRRVTEAQRPDMTEGEQSMARAPRTPYGPYSLDDRDYGLPEKHLFPLHTPEQARRSWDMLDRMPGLSQEDHDTAEDRILGAIHAFGGPPEHDLPPLEQEPLDLGDDEDNDTGEAGAETQEPDENHEVQDQDDEAEQGPQTDENHEAQDDDDDGSEGDEPPEVSAGAAGARPASVDDEEEEDMEQAPRPAAAAVREADREAPERDDTETDTDDDDAVREAQHDGVPARIPLQFMAVGWGNQRDKHFYSEEAVRALVTHIQGQPKMFISHSDMGEVQRHGHRPLEQLGAIAVRESVRYDPVRRACIGEAVLRPAMREFVEVAQAAGDTIGISVDAKGLFKPGTKECVGWSQFYSADFVPKGGAGGFTLAVREADRPDLQEEEKEFVRMSLLDTLSTADVREANLALYEAIGREYAQANPVTETVREADTAEVERLVRENETLAEERNQVLARLDEVEAERNREQVARFVEQLVQECGIEGAPQASYVAKMFTGATCGPRGTYETREALEGAVRESATEYLATLPAPAPTGEITGLGGAHTESGGTEKADWVDPFRVANEGMALIWGHQGEAPVSQAS